jgi:hypothetical protein
LYTEQGSLYRLPLGVLLIIAAPISLKYKSEKLLLLRTKETFLVQLWAGNSQSVSKKTEA